MSGAIPLHPVHAFVVCNELIYLYVLPLPLHFTYYNFKIRVEDRS